MSWHGGASSWQQGQGQQWRKQSGYGARERRRDDRQGSADKTLPWIDKDALDCTTDIATEVLNQYRDNWTESLQKLNQIIDIRDGIARAEAEAAEQEMRKQQEKETMLEELLETQRRQQQDLQQITAALSVSKQHKAGAWQALTSDLKAVKKTQLKTAQYLSRLTVVPRLSRSKAGRSRSKHPPSDSNSSSKSGSSDSEAEEEHSDHAESEGGGKTPIVTDLMLADKGMEEQKKQEEEAERKQKEKEKERKQEKQKQDRKKEKEREKEREKESKKEKSKEREKEKHKGRTKEAKKTKPAADAGGATPAAKDGGSSGSGIGAAPQHNADAEAHMAQHDK